MIVVSTHFDDGIGSCAGLLARLLRCGSPAQLVTVMSRPPALPFLKHLGRSVGGRKSGESWWYRAREDQRACHVLGVARGELGFVDALYRRSATGTRLYPSAESLNSRPHRQDESLPELIAAAALKLKRDPQEVFLFPLAIGDHVDHQLTALAGLLLLSRGAPVIFYRDFFYRGRPTRAQEQLSGAQRVDLRLTDEEVRLKQAALAEYTSQIGPLYGSVSQMIRDVAARESVEAYHVPAHAPPGILQRLRDIAA